MNNTNIKLEYTINKIKIILDLSDPSKKGTTIPLTRNMLYIPKSTATERESTKDSPKLETGEKSEYPFFTGDVKYPKWKLNKLDYTQRIDFFFNKDYFKEIIDNYADNPNSNDAEVDANANTFFDSNVTTMINILFPTIFPVINNNVNSWNRYIVDEGKPKFEITLKGAIPKMFTNISPGLQIFFSYIKTDKVYTITKTTWLNDFINHPLYRNLLDLYIKFNKWRIDESAKINEKQDKLKKKIEEDIKKQITDKSKSKPENKYKIIAGLISLYTKFTQTQTGSYSSTTTTNNAYIITLIELIQKLYNIEINVASPPPTLAAEGSVGPTGETNIKKQYDILKTKNKEQILKLIKLYIKNTKPIPQPYITFNTEFNKDTIFETAINLRDKFKENTVSIPSELKERIMLIINETVKMNTLSKINEKYFKDSDEINIKFDEDSDEIKKEFTETNYKNYFEFVKSIQLLVKPNTESTNKKLQDMIFDYTQGTDTAFGDYLKYVKNRYLDNNNLIKYPFKLFELLALDDNTKGVYENYLKQLDDIKEVYKDVKNEIDEALQTIKNIKPLEKNIKNIKDSAVNVKEIADALIVITDNNKSAIIQQSGLDAQKAVIAAKDLVDALTNLTSILKDIDTAHKAIEAAAEKVKKVIELEYNTELKKIEDEFNKNKTHIRPTDPLYVGVNMVDSSKTETPRYEIHVKMDVILGELTENNISEVKCSYNGEDLGEKFNQLIKKRGHNPWEISKHRPFYDLNKLNEIKNAKKKELDEFEKKKAILKQENAKRSQENKSDEKPANKQGVAYKKPFNPTNNLNPKGGFNSSWSMTDKVGGKTRKRKYKKSTYTRRRK